MTTFRDIVGNEVEENGQTGHSSVANDDSRPVDSAAELPMPQALVPYDASNSVIWLDSQPIEVALPGIRSVTRTNWTARLVGTGMVAATVASGMLLADSLHNQAPTDKKDNSLAKTPAAQPKTSVNRLPQPPIATPESLLPDALAGDETAAGGLPLKPGTLQSRLPKLLMKPTKIADQLAKVEVPGTPRFSINSNFKMGTPILRSVQDLPSVAVNQTPPAPEPLAPPANVLSTLPPPPVVQPMMMATATPSPTIGLQADSTPVPAPAAVKSTLTPVAPSPASSTTPLPTTEPAVQWVTTNVAKGSDQPSPPVMQPNAAPPDQVFTAPTQPTTARPAATAIAKTPIALAAATTVPQSIQDFVQMQQPSPWLPLTRQAAIEALATNQVNQFRVFRINVKDYQSIWRKSSQGLKELPPVNGFVDYGQQVIIVPQSSADITTQPTTMPTTATQSSAGNGLPQSAAPTMRPGNQPTEGIPLKMGQSAGQEVPANHQLARSN